MWGETEFSLSLVPLEASPGWAGGISLVQTQGKHLRDLIKGYHLSEQAIASLVECTLCVVSGRKIILYGMGGKRRFVCEAAKQQLPQ